MKRLHIRDAVDSSRKRRRTPKRRMLAALLLAVASMLVLANTAPVFAAMQPPSQQQLQAEANELREFLDNASQKELLDKNALKGALDDALGRGLLWGLLRSNRNLASCQVVKQLTHLLEMIARLQEKHPSAALEELYTKVWTLRSDILQSMPEGERCEGFEGIGTEPTTSIKESDNKHVAFDVQFSLPTLTTVRAGDETFTRTHLPGVENMVGTPGEPAVPMWRKLIALPEGATPVVKTSEVKAGGSLRINLVPFQEQAVDQATPPEDEEGEQDIPPLPPPETFADKPFQVNRKTYETDRLVPPNPCKVTPMGQYRDVQMAQLECATAQYNPVSDQYLMHRGMNVEIAFEGGADHFITSRTFGPFESAAKLTTESALNRDVLTRYVKEFDISNLICFGEEFLILTHEDFREAADRLADHKRDRGMSTSVFNVGAGVASRDTAEEIDDFIEDRYDDCQVRPSYVLLMGDSEFVPTFYRPDMPDNPGTDFPYSNYVQILFDAFFPDFGTGRIPVDTLAQADTVVDKIVKYESDPPNLGLGNGGPYYTTAGIASQFQCCRTTGGGVQAGTDQRAFIQTSELVRDELLDRGYSAPRIYTETVDGDYVGDDTPRRYHNGGLLPAALGGGSGFAWDGDTNDIANAWDDGRFLFLHRDHGWPGGWAHPGFSTSDVDDLSNGDKLPVVFSVNCASGIFDNETAGGIYGTTNSGVYFAERALRKADGGAIGIIGDTRNSPTWANNALTRGFFDAVWPDTVPTHGGNTSHKRLGDILNWGKVYLAGQVGVTQPAGSVSVDDMGYEYNIWHVIGDPTLEMWTKNPYKITLPNKVFAEQFEFGEIIRYDHEGAVITKLQVGPEGEMRSIGRATVQDGTAKMDYFQEPDPRAKTIYAASFDDAVSVMLEPERGEDPPSVD